MRFLRGDERRGGDLVEGMTNPASVVATPLLRPLSMLAAAAAWIAGATLACPHPVDPLLTLLGYAAWCWIALRCDAWPIVLLAALPIANAGPWTGWIVFDEFDLLALGAIGAAQARQAWPGRFREGSPAPPPMPGWTLVLVCAFLGTTMLAWARGFVDPMPGGGWFAGYGDRLNSLRIGKSAIYAVMLLPTLREAAQHSRVELFRRTALGMVCGTIVVAAAATWERWAYPGLVDFSEPYRTVALFWEMHVGGAALDAYLAMAAPFVAWTVVRAATPLRFLAAAALALVVEYVCLTTFSRGVYLAVASSLVLLALWLVRRGEMRNWIRIRRLAAFALIAALLVQAAFVLGGDSYPLRRVKSSVADLGARLTHWRNGLALVDGPLDTLLGIGLGRFPSVYAALAPDGKVPGEARVTASPAGSELVLKGPQGARRPGSFALAQRTNLTAGPHRVVVELRSVAAVRIAVGVCATHLLFDERCELGEALVEPTGDWQRVTIPLRGLPGLAANGWQHATVFSMHLPDPGSIARIRFVSLTRDGELNALRNADFEHGLSRWYPVARDDFLPWHIDSLPLEVLIERGALGLAAFALLVGHALRELLAAGNRGLTAAPFLAASLLGALLVGLVSSVLDASRIAFLLLYLVAVSLAWSEPREAVQKTDVTFDPNPHA